MAVDMSPGLEGITVEMLKYGGKSVIELMHHM